MDLLDEIYETHYGEEKMPYNYDPYLEKNFGVSADWDLHHYNVGMAHACLRHGIRTLKSGEEIVLVVGRGKHKRSTGSGNLKPTLLTSEILLEDIFIDECPKHPGRLILTKK